MIRNIIGHYLLEYLFYFAFRNALRIKVTTFSQLMILLSFTFI
jgi:hypothetical protein